MLNAALIGSIAAAGAGNGTGGAALPEDEPLPPPLATKSANTGNISTVLSGAQPGDRINLSNGSYGGLTIDSSGTQANPLVIRAANFVAGSTSHGVNTGSVTVNGSWVIISGIDITGAYICRSSNNRITRSHIHGSSLGCLFGPDVHDNLVDHCEVSHTTDRMFYLEDPKTAHHITVARCWCHTLAAGANTDLSHCFLWQDENEFRERLHHVIVRLCYCGPGVSSDTSSDYIHSKGSEQCYAFNRWDVGGDLLSFRFGFRKQFVGNYAPSASFRVRDDSHRVYGNRIGEVEIPCGISAYYDLEKSLIENNQGGQPAATRLRMSGNNVGTTIAGHDLSNGSWCTRSDGPLPDMRPAGDAKPSRSWQGVDYAAIPAGDGVSIRAHTGTITVPSPAPCLASAFGSNVVNFSNLPGSAAPASWLAELLAQFPWMEDICPDPTSLTGGTGGSAPWSIAQALTRGDAATPNTGPFRDSPGGLP